MHLGDKDLITVPFVQNTLERFAETDDVFTLEFAKSAVWILLYEGSQPRPDDAFLDNLSPYSCSNCIYQKSNPAEKWLEGPYFLQGKELHQCWRLYPDHLSAFAITTIPDDQNDHRFVPLGVTSDDGADLAVAVPSRLYFPQDANKPLNGLRVSVKDNYHLAGTVTTLGNRSYGKYYGVQNITSAYVERLIEVGCVVLGKTKLSSFAGTEVPPKGPVDYFPPFSPRADLYQSLSGSSVGAGCAIAGYGWMDLALGTDTTGSTRAPAASNGVWALRPTWGALSMEGIVPSVEEFDTVGLMARDVETLHNVYKVTGPEKSLKERCIEMMQNWSNQKHQEMLDAFTIHLEKYLAITRTEISLSETWAQTGPEGEKETPLRGYLQKVGYNINMWNEYHNFADFRDGYAAKYGEAPYISPVSRAKWENGSKITVEELDEAVRRRKVFADWIHEQVIGEAHKTIMVVPYGSPEPKYRDEAPPAGGNSGPSSYNPNFFATILDLPEVIVPIGQIPFVSKVTKRTEYLPTVAGLVGEKGMDEILLQLSKDALAKAGCPTKDLPGRLVFNTDD
ncbi:Glutamyl-tRNA [Talaromyces pinophilus]|nr:Glutamyl-tRNA [Talaromyces pinophilus]